MSTPNRLLIHGATGRMGESLLRLSPEFEQLQLVAAVGGHKRPEISTGAAFDAAHLCDAPEFDVCIDFSLPAGFDDILACCLERGAAFVCGTTGLSTSQHRRLEDAANRIPVLWSANFSLGIAVLTDLVRRAAAALPDWQRDLVESHHIHKKDAPSGTALALGHAVRQSVGEEPHYHSLRAGDIVGEHLLQLTGPGERIELVHRATNRDIFARGALRCASELAQRSAGRYGVLDLLV